MASQLTTEILKILISNALAAIISIWTARHAARYAARLSAKPENHSEVSRETKTVKGKFIKRVSILTIIVLLIDIVMFLLDSWFLWALIQDPSPVTRGAVFAITFYTFLIVYWGNRLLSDAYAALW